MQLNGALLQVQALLTQNAMPSIDSLDEIGWRRSYRVEVEQDPSYRVLS